MYGEIFQPKIHTAGANPKNTKKRFLGADKAMG